MRSGTRRQNPMKSNERYNDDEDYYLKDYCVVRRLHVRRPLTSELPRKVTPDYGSRHVEVHN